MESKGLLFIPDISGFTRFVNATEITHSKLIIEELLNVLVNANQTGLQVSEIEGDAILFYKYGQPPKLDELYGQVEKMFCAFHQSLISYEQRRYCWCEACRSAIHLSLKVITHYGEFTGYSVQNFNKLIGKDVIVAHQLLKNEIEPHEYWLVTDSLLLHSRPENFTDWMKWNTSSKQTEEGELSFQYTYISPLKNTISEEPPAVINLFEMSKMFSLEREYETDVIRLFHASGNFNYRSQWMEGVQRVEGITHSIPRIGTQCKYITGQGEVNVRSNSYSSDPDRVEFTEVYGNNNYFHHYILEKVTDSRTKLIFSYYVPNTIFSRLAFGLTGRKKAEASMSRSLERIGGVLKQALLPGEE